MADGRELLFIDTPTRRVDRFDVDPTGRAHPGRRLAVEIAAGHGWPDGMTIDAEGIPCGSACGTGGPSSGSPRTERVDRRVELPAAQVTSCTFGGPDLDELDITTVQEGFPPGGLPDQPEAGGLFRYRAGVNGLRTRRFAG